MTGTGVRPSCVSPHVRYTVVGVVADTPSSGRGVGDVRGSWVVWTLGYSRVR